MPTVKRVEEGIWTVGPYVITRIKNWDSGRWEGYKLEWEASGKWVVSFPTYPATVRFARARIVESGVQYPEVQVQT